MIVDTLACLLLVLGVAFGLSRPVVDRLDLTPAEGIVAGAALSLIGAWLVAWTVFTSGCPLSAYGLIPVLAASGLVLGRRGIGRIAADPAARDLAAGQLLVTAWCVAWLSFIRNHSGGAWLGDWVEHWQRAHFFLREWPADQPFFDIYQMPARPPLANVLTAVFMHLTRADYAHYQVIMAALCSLAYLPVGLLAARFGGPRAARLAAVVLLVNPLFIQNATYPWTKLPAVFFVLAGLYFFLRVRDRDAGLRTAAVLCAICLGGAVVTHYSAGPYVVVIAAAWVAIGRRTRWAGGFAGLTKLAAAAGACVLLPWFLWSGARYGWHATFLSNSSVSMMEKAPGNPALVMILNLRDSLIPPQVRGFTGTLFTQSSRWGSLRDQLFIVYQLNPLLALGCVGSVAVVAQGFRAAKAASRRELGFWICALSGIVVLSFASYGDRDHYGTGHICLQSVVLLGLAFLASRWDRMGAWWKRALIAGWAVDFCLGIALQFAVEDFAIDRWVDPTLSLPAISRTYGVVSQENLREKIIAQLSYFADILPTPPALVLALMGAILCMALLRARPMPGESRQP
jgi:4-amino-4-deoxy-L-arabinose transferase-like glycosyltransferase